MSETLSLFDLTNTDRELTQQEEGGTIVLCIADDVFQGPG